MPPEPVTGFSSTTFALIGNIDSMLAKVARYKGSGSIEVADSFSCQ